MSIGLLSQALPASAEGAMCPKRNPAVMVRQGAVSSIRAKLSRHEPVRILAIGSSSTEGIGSSSPDNTYPAQLEDELTDLWKGSVTVVNAGRGGETAIQTIERLETALSNGRFDLVIWQVGTNDAITGVSEEAFRALLERGIAAAKNAGTDMMLLDQQYFPSIKDLPRYERFVQAVSTVAQARNVQVFSRYTLMKGWNSQSPDELRSMLSADGFHMGDKGYDCLADCMADAIQAMVAQPVADGSPAPKVTASAE